MSSNSLKFIFDICFMLLAFAIIVHFSIQSILILIRYLLFSFAEIIPQSLCTRYGLYLGAKMAKPTQMLIYALVSPPILDTLIFLRITCTNILWGISQINTITNSISTPPSLLPSFAYQVSLIETFVYRICRE